LRNKNHRCFFDGLCKEIYRQGKKIGIGRKIVIFCFFRKKFLSSYRFFRENLGLRSAYFRDRRQVNLWCFPSYLRYLTLYCV